MENRSPDYEKLKEFIENVFELSNSDLIWEKETNGQKFKRDPAMIDTYLDINSYFILQELKNITNAIKDLTQAISNVGNKE